MKAIILMLTHNRLEAVQKCLESLLASGVLQAGQDGVGLILLDNDSEAEAWNWIRQWADARIADGLPVRWVRSPENFGVAKGRNKLVEYWLANRPELDAEYLIFLDSDVKINKQGWVEVLLAPFEHPSVGVTGTAGSIVRWELGVHPFYPLGAGPCDVVAGWCMAVRAELFREGLRFDEGYGLFWEEDSDLCMQVQARNKCVICVGNIGLRHHPGLSGAAKSANRRRALWRFEQKWRQPRTVQQSDPQFADEAGKHASETGVNGD